MDEQRVEMAVVGGGGAGTMAYLRGVLNRTQSALFLGDADSKRKGRSTWVMHVDNIPGMHDQSRPITGTAKSTLDWLNAQPELAPWGQVHKAAVQRVERTEDGGFRLHWTERGGEERSLETRTLIVATGVMDVQPEIDGSIQPILPFANRGDALYCVRCDGHKTIDKELSVIGAKDTAIHIASMMADRYGHERVQILTNGLEESFSPEVLELAEAYGMSVHRSPIAAVRGDARGDGLEGFTLADGSAVDTDCAIVSLGAIVYNDLLKQLGAELDATGRPVLGERYETSVPGVFAVGDLVAGHKMQVYTAWDEAVDAADAVDARLRAEKRAAKLEALRARA